MATRISQTTYKNHVCWGNPCSGRATAGWSMSPSTFLKETGRRFTLPRKKHTKRFRFSPEADGIRLAGPASFIQFFEDRRFGRRCAWGTVEKYGEPRIHNVFRRNEAMSHEEGCSSCWGKPEILSDSMAGTPGKRPARHGHLQAIFHPAGENDRSWDRMRTVVGAKPTELANLINVTIRIRTQGDIPPTTLKTEAGHVRVSTDFNRSSNETRMGRSCKKTTTD